MREACGNVVMEWGVERWREREFRLDEGKDVVM